MNSIIHQLLTELESAPPDMQEEALDFVQFLKTKRLKIETLSAKPPEPNGIKASEILNELAARGTAFQEINDPAAWQREIRQDRSLPGRP